METIKIKNAPGYVIDPKTKKVYSVRGEKLKEMKPEGDKYRLSIDKKSVRIKMAELEYDLSTTKEETKTAEPAKPKKENLTLKKVPAKTESKKEESPFAKDTKEKRPGLINTIFETIKGSKMPVTITDIHDVLCATYPHKNAKSMLSTISVQLGAKKPMRMERERKVEIEVEVIEGVKYFSLKK